MIRQTGGRAVGATSTRSSPSSRALRSASAVEVEPILFSFSSMRKIGEMRICSLWRKFVEMAFTPWQNFDPLAAHARRSKRTSWMQNKSHRLALPSADFQLPNVNDHSALGNRHSEILIGGFDNSFITAAANSQRPRANEQLYAGI